MPLSLWLPCIHLNRVLHNPPPTPQVTPSVKLKRHEQKQKKRDGWVGEKGRLKWESGKARASKREKIDKRSERRENEGMGLEAESKFQLSPWTRLCQTAAQWIKCGICLPNTFSGGTVYLTPVWTVWIQRVRSLRYMWPYVCGSLCMPEHTCLAGDM